MYLSFYFQIHTERNMNLPNSVPNSMPNSCQIVLILTNSDLELRSRSHAKSTLFTGLYHQLTKVFHGCTDQHFTLSGVTFHAKLKHAKLFIEHNIFG